MLVKGKNTIVYNETNKNQYHSKISRKLKKIINNVIHLKINDHCQMKQTHVPPFQDLIITFENMRKIYRFD